MEFIRDNYILIIIICGFLIFAIVGYLIDMLRNNNPKETTTVTPEEIKSVEPNKAIDNTNKETISNDPDELLQTPEFTNKK